LALVAALVAALAVVTLATAAAGSAQQHSAPLAPLFPEGPHWFYGKAVTDQGKPLAEGTVVAAKTVTGSWTGSVSTTVDFLGEYGYNPQLYVPGIDTSVPNSGARQGDKIAFYVLGVQAKVRCDPALSLGPCAAGTQTWTDTYPMTYYGHTHLDLQVAISYTITASAGPHGSITPAGAVKVNYGFDQGFTITPDADYLRLDVLVDGVSNPGAVASGVYTFTNVTANHTISASFVKATYLITPSAGPGCTITPPTQQVVPYKGSQSFTIAANTGYDLTDVKVDNVSQGPITSYTFSNVTADHTIAATCTLKTFVITPSAGAGGAISPATPQTVNWGGSQKFDFTPNTGYLIDDVLVDGVSNPGAVAAGSYTFTDVQAAHTIAVTFKLQTFVITPSAGAGGAISPATPQTVGYGGSQKFDFLPNSGYLIDDVLVDGVSNPGAVAAGSYTFTDVTAAHTIAVTFKRAARMIYLPLILGAR
jgi:hypothetical protein